MRPSLHKHQSNTSSLPLSLFLSLHFCLYVPTLPSFIFLSPLWYPPCTLQSNFLLFLLSVISCPPRSPPPHLIVLFIPPSCCLFDSSFPSCGFGSLSFCFSTSSSPLPSLLLPHLSSSVSSSSATVSSSSPLLPLNLHLLSATHFQFAFNSEFYWRERQHIKSFCPKSERDRFGILLFGAVRLFTRNIILYFS